jgi:GT2 family glycosyltransferase
MSDKGISIKIPSWNGRELLRRHLPSLMDALSSYNGKSEVIVVDDGSTDGSAEFISSAFPSIRVLSLKKNMGFVAACNHGVRASRHEIVYMLNNDISMEKDFLTPLLTHFEDEKLFSVSSVLLPPSEESDPEPGIPLATVRFRLGIFWYYYRYKEHGTMKKAEHVFFTSGGHTAYDKNKFIKLGGFDGLYHPFYWEDADISYRAWKCGWHSLLEPESRGIHYSQSTIGANFDRNYIQMIHWRNRFLFTWKNLDSFSLWLYHLIMLPFELLGTPLIGRAFFTRGFFLALGKLPELLKSRRKRERCIMNDRDVLRIFKRE